MTRNYDYETSVTGLKRGLGWANLSTRRDIHDCVMWYKIYYQFVLMPFPYPVKLKPRLSFTDHDLAYARLQHLILAYKYSFFVRTIPLWNALKTLPIVSATTVEALQEAATDPMLGQARP